MNETSKARLGLIPALAERGADGHIGRTALMKYLYFLQTLRGVPLEYSFSLYSYGPFDSDVLSDLSSAQLLNIVDVAPVEFSGGYGYRIRPGARAKTAKENASGFLKKHQPDIDWVFSKFGTLNSAQLELASTIVYVDRELADRKQRSPIDKVAMQVNEIKPHFSGAQVKNFVEKLLDEHVLSATVR
jgi:hypothetical protein